MHTHTRTHTRICSKRSISDGNAGAGWQSQCPAEDVGLDLHPAALPIGYGGCEMGRTNSDGRDLGQSGNAQTDLSLSSSSSNSLWEEERGRCSRPPKVHTAGKEEMLSGLVEINHDSGTVALTHVGSPRELSEVGLEMAARKIDLVGVPLLARWPPKLLRGKACLQSCNVPSPPGSRSVSRAAPSTLSKAGGGAEGAVHKGAWAARKALCPPALT